MTKEVTILNTRAIEQQTETCSAFADYGFLVLNFPCIRIATVDDSSKIMQQLDALHAQDVLVFTSQHAVHHAYKIYPKWQLKKTCVVITVGTKTAQVLEQSYAGDIWIPAKQNSEGVIELLQGLKTINAIKLITAANGRDKIQKFAQLKSINLQQINVYQRQLPSLNPSLNQALSTQLAANNKLIILATSVTTIDNLQKLVEAELFNHLKRQTLICASSRIQQVADKLGFTNTINSQTANPELMAEKCQQLL